MALELKGRIKGEHRQARSYARSLLQNGQISQRQQEEERAETAGASGGNVKERASRKSNHNIYKRGIAGYSYPRVGILPGGGFL